MPAVQANIMRTYGYSVYGGRYPTAYADTALNTIRKAMMVNKGGDIRILPVTKFTR